MEFVGHTVCISLRASGSVTPLRKTDYIRLNFVLQILFVRESKRCDPCSRVTCGFRRSGSVHSGLQPQWSVHASWWTQRPPCDDGLEEVTAGDGIAGTCSVNNGHACCKCGGDVYSVKKVHSTTSNCSLNFDLINCVHRCERRRGTSSFCTMSPFSPWHRKSTFNSTFLAFYRNSYFQSISHFALPKFRRI